MSTHQQHTKTIFVLPDVQAKPGNDFSFLTAIGRYIVDKKPDVVLCGGDFSDMESLSSYDVGKKSFEGRSYNKDIWAARDAMDALLMPFYEFNKKAKKNKDKQYDIKTTKDVVSLLAPLQKNSNDIIIPSQSNNLYIEHKIDVLDRLNQDLIVGKGINKIRLNNDDIKLLIKYVMKHKKIKNKYTKYDIELLKSIL
jgi:hypothetical protein